MDAVTQPSFGQVTQIEEVRIDKLRPTQVTVGLREVEEKRAEWRRADRRGRDKLLRAHVVPTVIGPKGRHYLIDHHHLARALFDEGHERVWAAIVAELDHLEPDEFWTVMDGRNYVHPFDGDGLRVAYAAIPKQVGELADDPYRSLAGAVRRNGGFSKNTAPFSEFLWADYFRRRLAPKQVRKNFETALGEAMRLAGLDEASHLPGWTAPTVAAPTG